MAQIERRVSLITAIVAALLAHVSPAFSQPTAEDDISAAEEAGRRAADAAIAGAEEQLRLQEQRLALCRSSVLHKVTYPENVIAEQARHPELGSRLALLELCQVYLHGYVDGSNNVLDGLKRVVR